MAASPQLRLTVAALLLLVGVSVLAKPRDIHGTAANEAGTTIADTGAVDGSSNDPSPTPVRAQKPTPTATVRKAKAPPMVRGDADDDAAHTPRWHSFLPGMFR